jgi:heat-inducible transcriptional repressor
MTRLTVKSAPTALTERQNQLLAAIIEEYLKTAHPVGSVGLAEERNLPYSPATIRNEMQYLEDAGYLEQPHTSAGRIPTVKAWREYLKDILPDVELPEKRRVTLAKALTAERRSDEDPVKALARTLADFVGETVIVGFTPHDVYYTGLSNLFGKPEFEALDLVREISAVVDHLDDVMEKLAPSVTEETVLLGNENPFADECAVVVTRYQLPGRQPIIGILGPLRQDYSTNVGALRYARELLA